MYSPLHKRESKARMPIKFYCLFFVNCGLFSFLNIKRGKIYNENTVADGNVLCNRIVHYIISVNSTFNE